MPGRTEVLVNNEVYHIYNRGIDHRSVFSKGKECSRAYELIRYYRFSSPPIRYSHFSRKTEDEKQRIYIGLETKDQKLVEILAFCLMPNHFHFLLKQNLDSGISKFLGNFENSYTRYFNTKNERIGPIFLNQFKAVRIETDEQLIHVNRYIHLNPYTSYIVSDFNQLCNYPWSSFEEYINEGSFSLCSKDLILSNFKDRTFYKGFVLDHADYQRQLHKIKHLALE